MHRDGQYEWTLLRYIRHIIATNLFSLLSLRLNLFLVAIASGSLARAHQICKETFSHRWPLGAKYVRISK